jgi:hypothetical protein
VVLEINCGQIASTDKRTDGQGDSNIPPPNFVAGGIKISRQEAMLKRPSSWSYCCFHVYATDDMYVENYIATISYNNLKTVALARSFKMALSLQLNT